MSFTAIIDGVASFWNGMLGFIPLPIVFLSLVGLLCFKLSLPAATTAGAFFAAIAVLGYMGFVDPMAVAAAEIAVGLMLAWLLANRLK